jgi:CHAD domain-containing protein
MAYSLKPGDGTLQEGLRRIAVDQISSAIAEIGDASLGRDETVHQVRKRCKKLRGLIRLARPGFEGYKAENAAFREAARRLSGLRDADVLIETYDKLMERQDGGIDRPAFGQIRRRLSLRRKALVAEERIDAGFDAVRGEMETALARAKAWKVGGEGFDVAVEGMAKTYGRARKAMRKARKARSDAAMHDWRKRVKYHRYHAQILKRIFPGPMEAHAEAADRLGDLLGDHHDLAVFGAVLRADPRAFGEKATVRQAQELVAEAKQALEADAFALGARLFAEKTKRIASRWEDWWDVWRDEAARGRGSAGKAARGARGRD